MRLMEWLVSYCLSKMEDIVIRKRWHRSKGLISITDRIKTAIEKAYVVDERESKAA